MSSPPTLPPTDFGDLAQAREPAVRHLDWCMPAFCETATYSGRHSIASETLHRGEPVVWQMNGDDADVVMRRCQYGNEGETFYEVHFSHRAYREDILLTFSEADEARLITGFHELRNR